MSDIVSLTASSDRILSPVRGQIPPFANVDASTEADSLVTSIEHSCLESKLNKLMLEMEFKGKYLSVEVPPPRSL